MLLLRASRHDCRPCGLSEVLLYHFPHVEYVVNYETAQCRFEYKQLFVVGIIKPAKDVNSVFRLQLVVVHDVVNNYCLSHISSQQRQIFNVSSLSETATVAVKSEFDVSLLVEVIENPVSVVL